MDIITGKILKLNNWPDGKIIGLAKKVGAQLGELGFDRENVLTRLEAVRQNPGSFLADELTAELARECIRIGQKDLPSNDTHRETPLDYPIWGKENIDEGSIAQMDNAMRLPVSVAGALMPDAHVGYGLPIGGVLATENAVIPLRGRSRHCLSNEIVAIRSISSPARTKKGLFEQALLRQTAFGMGAQWKGSDRADHPVLDDSAWTAIPLLRTLKDNAMCQLGTSGTGNHFVEWGSFRLFEALSGVEPGEYLALLSHSGSRSVGFKIADRYSKLAIEKHPDLDKSIRQLAWLSLDSAEGQEYWLSMELAGRFASANHYIIHHRVAQAIGLTEALVVENHHNFAWAEKLPDGRNVIVHRKGATPASTGILGVIPGSMGDAGYVVRGRGAGASLESASHGAGRLMSRKAALNSISKSTRDEYLRERGITLLGGGMDEAPQAYKPIDSIIAAQNDLVDVIGKFMPRIVRMADDAGEY